MYTKLEISNFRAFSSLTAAPLNRLNLISGDNNIGKTGILEAIYLLQATSYDQLKELPKLFRRTQEDGDGRIQDDIDNFWLWLFHKRDLTQSWKITANDPNGTNSVKGSIDLRANESAKEQPYIPGTPLASAKLHLTHRFGEKQPTQSWLTLHKSNHVFEGNVAPQPVITAVSTRFQPPTNDAELVNKIAVRNEEEELIEYLRLVEPRLSKLKYLRLPDHKYPYVYADIGFGRGKELIPATQLGQGFSRLLSLFATILVSRTQILLIDEFENGLQHDALVPIWKSLDQLARNRGIQIFATTHSYECISAAHEAATEAPDYDLSVLRLQWSRAKEVEAVVLDREAIGTALDAHLEVR